MVSSIVLAFAFLIDKVNVSASSIALSEQGWKANFSTQLKTSAIDNGDIYLVDQQGKEVDADLTLVENGHSVEVSNLKPGSYTLHVSRNAVKGGFLKSMSTNELSFTVHKDLQTVKSETELKDYLKKVASMYASRNESRFLSETVQMESSSEDKATGNSEGESNHSETNNQVEGVDEADMVKTDGEYIYSIMNGQVVITDVRNPKSMVKMSDIPASEDFYPSQLFLHEDTLIILGDHHIPYDYSDVSAESTDKMMMVPFSNSTNVRFYDVSNPQKPTMVREIGAEGYLNGARKTDNMLYFVTNVSPNFWALEQGEDVEVRPYIFDSEVDKKASPMDLSNISILPGSLEGTYSIITAMDLNNPKDSKVETKGYLGGSQSMYMTKESLYLTAPVYLPVNQDSQSNRTMMWNPIASNTEIFKFTLDGTNISFASSGEVDGMLLNQFSMDEHEDYFRVVTTKGFAWDEETPSENNLYILDAGMKQVGAIEGLAEGERIYSARFMGDKAYMVTFKETDPLFVLDVATPTAPKVLGELKIPGFSNYLHPLDENHLIGFGYDTKSIPGEKGQPPRIVTGGMKISLFDVTDFNNPKEQDIEIIGAQGTYSPLQYDHKALFQHRGKGLYGFPISLYEGVNQDGYGTFAGEGALMYEITAENGIREVANLINEKNTNMGHEDWEKSIQRMVYVEDTLYTISVKEIKSYDLNTFKELGIVTY